MLKKNTQIMLGVFALLLIVFILLNNTGGGDNGGVPTTDPLATPTTVKTVFDFDTSLVTGIRVENLDGNAVEFSKQGEVWLLNQPQTPAEETDITRIESLIGTFVSLRKVTDASIDASLGAIGLQTPPYRLTISLADGTEHVVAIGDKSVSGTGYYVSVDGEQPILATLSVLDGFINLLEAPPILPTSIPVPTTDVITDTVPLTEVPVLEPTATAQP